MKTVFFNLSFIALISIHLSAQWTQQNSSVKKNLYDVSFFNSKIGYAVGEKGLVLKTINGGNKWIEVTSPADKDIISVTAIDSAVVIITTSTGSGKAFIYKSKDQGTIWQKVLDDLRPFYVTATPSKNLYSVSSQIYKSADAGKNWIAQKQLNSTSTYNQISFSNNTNGIVAGNISGILTYSTDFLRTTDGTNWYSGNSFSFPNANGFSAFSAVSADSVYMFTNFYNRFLPGDSSQLILLTNFRLKGPLGSQVWLFDSKILINSLQDRISDCKFFPGGTAYAVSEAGVIYSASQNNGYKKEYSSKTALHAVYMLNKENGFVVGDGGLILKRQGISSTYTDKKSSLKNNNKPVQAEQ